MGDELFRAFVFKTTKEPRKDKGNVFKEAVERLKENLPDEIRNNIQKIEKIKSPEVKERELVIYLTKNEEKVNGIPLNRLFEQIYNEILYINPKLTPEYINKKVGELKKDKIYRKIDTLLEVAISLWKKLEETHCLVMISKKVKKPIFVMPLVYILINGKKSNLEEVSIFVKKQTVPCEGICIRELSYLIKNNSWLDIHKKIENYLEKNVSEKDKNNVREKINEKGNFFKIISAEGKNLFIAGIGFNNDTMDKLVKGDIPPDTYSQYLVPLMKKGNSLINLLVSFLVSKSFSKESLKLDVDELKGLVKTEFFKFVNSARSIGDYGLSVKTIQFK